MKIVKRILPGIRFIFTGKISIHHFDKSDHKHLICVLSDAYQRLPLESLELSDEVKKELDYYIAHRGLWRTFLHKFWY